MRLLVETDIETGLRWAELTELRVKDLDVDARILTVCRVAVHLRAAAPDGARFLVKGYPKDRESRRVRLAPEIVEKLVAHVQERDLGPEDLLFTQPAPGERASATLPTGLPDPETLGLTAPNEAGLRYRHGTLTAYTNGRCRCRQCRAAMNAYRTERRCNGLDRPRRATSRGRDDHVSNSWFRTQIWRPALAAAQLGFHITPHGLRHAHASWLLAGGADVQVVKERLGHGSLSTTERYLRALPNTQDTALDALAVIRGRKPPAESGSAADAGQLAKLVDAVTRLTDLYSEHGGLTTRDAG